jgi:diadenosine tetraphosphate (Ap4A) HIT family hydrolase
MQTVPNCPFCLENKLLNGAIIAKTDNGFLVEALGHEGCYLIIPAVHTEQITDLPDTWWQDFKELSPHVPGLSENYNISLNIGRVAGQTVKHLHFWIVPRYPDKPSSNTGLAGLIRIVDDKK